MADFFIDVIARQKSALKEGIIVTKKLILKSNCIEVLSWFQLHFWVAILIIFWQYTLRIIRIIEEKDVLLTAGFINWLQ